MVTAVSMETNLAEARTKSATTVSANAGSANPATNGIPGNGAAGNGAAPVKALTAADHASPLTRDEATELVHELKLFADETRLQILSRLMVEGESNVQDLCRHLGQTQPAVSHHLAMLKEAGILRMRRSGKHNIYRLVVVPGQRLSSVLGPLMMRG